jgi:hypothetical protein
MFLNYNMKCLEKVRAEKGINELTGLVKRREKARDFPGA